jgi:hypothetical protein
VEKVDDENKVLSVACPSCNGTGNVGPSQTVSAEQGITIVICQTCKGQKALTVMANDLVWSLDIRGPVQRVIYGLTWGGKIIRGDPLSRTELKFFAEKYLANEGVIPVLLALASDNNELHKRLSELEARVAGVRT